ncbi:hypothetical protein AHF37_02061 [Paragonimus kellicotti]|nr:hypothetical protein AHF37_02061 [Paragonimus kellicotti]
MITPLTYDSFFSLPLKGFHFLFVRFPQGPSKRPAPPTTRVDRHCFTLSEAHVRLRLCILDTPGFGQSLDNSTCWQPIVDCIESQFEAYLRAELSVSRKTVGSGANCIPGLPDDNRVHACLYFVNPSGHGLHQVDVESLKKLHNLVNLILVIGKADTLTTEECGQFKQTISRQLQENGIQVYDFPESVVTLCGEPNEKTLTEVRSWRRRQPFAVVCSDRLIEQADGRKDLIDVTHARHYANYYSTRLTAIAEASQFPIQPEGREPLSQLEAEKAERQKKLAKLECEMEAVFELKRQRQVPHIDRATVVIRGRVYPWGLVETENLAHNDFTALKNLLMHVHLQDLIDVTHARHYANYYSTRLTAIAEASQFPIQPEGREPLSQLEAEKAERQKKLAKLECEMEAVFEQTGTLTCLFFDHVQERTAKLQENERDLEQRVAQWENQMALQLAEFERLRRAFEQQRDTWEAENRDALEYVQYLSATAHGHCSRRSVLFRPPTGGGRRRSNSPATTSCLRRLARGALWSVVDVESSDALRSIRGRVYPWGLVETENLAHNDFTALKNLLMHVHLQLVNRRGFH